MRKVCALALSIVLVLLMVVGCETSQPGCVHEYASKVTKKPTYDFEGIMEYSCSKCGDTYTEAVPKLGMVTIPTSVLDKALSNAKYYASPFSISVGSLVNRTMSNYEIKYMSGAEAISRGYLRMSDIDSSVDIDYLYYAIISGDTMRNPELPYLTVYEKEAVKVWMVFDKNNKLLNSGVTLCTNLQTCAILIMTN